MKSIITKTIGCDLGDKHSHVCALEVIVANARQVRLIYQGHRKNDRLDAEKLARLARADRQLLAPVRHRSDAAHNKRSMMHSRDQLVKARTQLINHVR